MLIGMMAIEMTGAVYCPLSPRDPQHRLHALVQQTQSHLILTHFLSRTKFNDNIISLDIDSVLTANDMESDVNIDRLCSVLVTPDSIAYIIFTSGSTGTPKAVQIRHRNFTEYMHSMLQTGAFSENDTFAQMPRCSFDAHIQDTMGTLLIGATVVMLHPGGNLDFDYLVKIIKWKQITWILMVPSLLYSYFTFLQQINQLNSMECLRSVFTGGEPWSVKLVNLIRSHCTEKCRIWNLYGPAETTIGPTIHLVDGKTNADSIPIGVPLLNYRCMIQDEFLQSVTIGQEGELLVGGVGVFTGYLGRDDLTMKALIEIKGELFYRTGDLVRIDSNGLLHYQGRKDHQIKLHGQRIELGEIERCLLNNTSVSACVVIKWGDGHLVAYALSFTIDASQLREHCQLHLPPHMIPSIFIILDKLPLNANGKVDRKSLPAPEFSIVGTINSNYQLPLTLLEEHLSRIYSESFHIEFPDVNVSFGQMGGTSLDAMRALWLIRKEICMKIDASLLFANPSIRQLACALQPLLAAQKDLSFAPTISQVEETEKRPMPSLCIELVGILLLMCQWTYPLWLTFKCNSFFMLIFVPIFHLLSYVICQRVLLRPGEIEKKIDKLYTWHYYRWWFLNRLWFINNSYWLQHLVGTSFYNSYLRLCGAQIGYHSHIYTTSIDAPWLLEIGESTFIGEEVVLSSLSYQDQTYELHPVRIGSHCTINTRCVLYDGVDIQDHSYIEPMSAVTGPISTSIDKIFIIDRSLSLNQTMYQFICLLSLILIHCILLFLVYFTYSYCSSLLLPMPISIAVSWFVWTLASLFIVLLLLKFIVGPVTSGHYRLNSHYYLHKIWLRQLIISSFHYSLDIIPSYDVIASIILRWLGAHIEDDVKFADFQHILRFPSNLLNVEWGVTTFGRVKLASYEITKEGLCYFDKIELGSDLNLGNGCTLMPGTQLSPKIIVGSLTLVTRETVIRNVNGILLGIPAREMPFTMPNNTSLVNDLPSSNSFSIHTLLLTCLGFLISKCLVITLYSSLPFIIAIFIYIILYCVLYRLLVLSRKKSTHSKMNTCIQNFLRTMCFDFLVNVGPYLSGTQFLIFLYRAVGARIGCDVILSDIFCLGDPHLVTIGDHVRLNMGASIQCHTFEQRLLKLAPITVNDSSVLMNSTITLSGSILHGQNRILPLTLVMKEDQLPPNTNWSGVPAEQVI